MREAVSTAYCTALKERLHERDRELDETRRQLDALREEHARAQTELVEARAKLEMYAEREKLPNAVGRDSEQVKTFPPRVYIHYLLYILP